MTPCCIYQAWVMTWGTSEAGDEGVQPSPSPGPQAGGSGGAASKFLAGRSPSPKIGGPSRRFVSGGRSPAPRAKRGQPRLPIKGAQRPGKGGCPRFARGPQRRRSRLRNERSDWRQSKGGRRGVQPRQGWEAPLGASRSEPTR